MTKPILSRRVMVILQQMGHMPLRFYLFQLKFERVVESPGLSSYYQDIRDNHGYQLRLKKIACRIFEG